MRKISYEDVMAFLDNKQGACNIKPSAIADDSDEIMRKINLIDEFSNLIQNIKNMIKMIKAYCSKRYTKIPKQTLMSVCFALFYVFCPVDLIPDTMPIIGYVDDVAVVEFVLKSTNKDIEDYIEWEKTQ